MVTAHHSYISRKVAGQAHLIRDFEGMYRDVEDPHGQELSANNGSHQIYLQIIAQILSAAGTTASDSVPQGPRSSFRYLDVGCGLGHFTRRVDALLRNRVFSDGISVTSAGIDVSSEAIDRAISSSSSSASTPIDFGQASLLSTAEIRALGEFDLVTCFEALCYFEDEEIEEVVHGLTGLVRSGGHLVLTLHLPETMSYGRYMSSLRDIRAHFPSLEGVWEMDFTDHMSRIYDGGSFGRHLFCAMRKPCDE
jgi:2-polyprenyl-3-methyl-5-hydroxy-6-metoxy-1,4-benzoquinol methylase